MVVEEGSKLASASTFCRQIWDDHCSLIVIKFHLHSSARAFVERELELDVSLCEE